MQPVVITHCSGGGHTRCLGGFVAEGLRGAGLSVVTADTDVLTDSDWGAMDAAPAIIFGAPTYMGSAAASFKSFMDASSDRWGERRWENKIAAGFTTAAYHQGDKLNTLLQLAVFAAQHAMIWVGQSLYGPAPGPESGAAGLNRDGSCLGLSATASMDSAILIHPDDAETARQFGARLADAVKRWGG